MYLSHYNLVEKPFQISTDPKFLWLGKKHREALAVLKYGIMNNQGFVLLTGDVGTGKTTLINALLKSLDKDTLVAVISDPKMDKIEFFNLTARAFRFKKSFQDKLQFTIYFGHFLKAAHRAKKKVLLIIDEAQNVSRELLEEIRLLSNIELPERKLLNTFFVGQEEFNKILVRNECRPLRQRITITYNIDPLTRGETSEYIAHRLQVAGATGDIFTRGAMSEVFSFSKGYPRLINIICDHALLTGYVKELNPITPRIVKECRRELVLPGELKSIKAQKPKTAKRERKKLGRRAILYACLIFLLMPLLYPPVSTALRGYLINVISFYDEVYHHLAGTAHSYNGREVGAQEYVTASLAPTPSLNQPTTTESKGPPDETIKIDESNGEESSASRKQSFNPADCRLTIAFEYNSNEVPETAYGPLKKCASIMLENTSTSMIVKGYSDSTGSYLYNKKLSEFRANIVKSYLSGRGISPTRIKTVAMGDENPLEPNTTAAGRRANRRVEIELVAESS